MWICLRWLSVIDNPLRGREAASQNRTPVLVSKIFNVSHNMIPFTKDHAKNFEFVQKFSIYPTIWSLLQNIMPRTLDSFKNFQCNTQYDPFYKRSCQKLWILSKIFNVPHNMIPFTKDHAKNFGFFQKISMYPTIWSLLQNVLKCC